MQSQDRLRVALLVAVAIALHGFERTIPTPIPWLRFGFANIITLTAVVFYGLRVALMITLIRVFVVSLFVGTFLGPGFILSLGGGLASTIAMGGVFYLLGGLFSPLGLSLIGAFAHNLAQLFLAYLLFVRKIDAILYLSPVILVFGVLAGTVNGLASGMLIISLREEGLRVGRKAMGKEHGAQGTGR